MTESDKILIAFLAFAIVTGALVALFVEVG